MSQHSRLERSMADYSAMLSQGRRELERMLQERGYTERERRSFMSQKGGMRPFWCTEERLEQWLETELQRWAKERG